MEKNMMQNIIGSNYTENPVLNYLNYWIQGDETYPNFIDKDEWRKKYEVDVNWLDGDLHADTLLSFGGPLMMAVNVLKDNKKYPSNFYKNNKYGNPSKFIQIISNDINNILPRGNKLVEEIYKFSEVACNRENVIRLPNRCMQKRGQEPYFDQMPKFLYECFSGGAFSSNFKDDENFKKWINEESLECFFVDGIISKNTIKPLLSKLKPSDSAWLIEEDDLLELFQNYNELLLLRKQLLNI